MFLIVLLLGSFGLLSALEDLVFAGFTYYKTRPELVHHYNLTFQLINNKTDGFHDNVSLNRTLSILSADTGRLFLPPFTSLLTLFSLSSFF